MRKIVRGTYWAVVLVITVFVFQSFIRMGINSYARALYLEMIDGTAYRPFVARMLVPGMVGMVSAITPVALREAVNDYAVNSVSLCARLTLLGMEPQAFYEYLVGAILMFGSLIGFVFVFRELLRAMFEAENPIADIATVFALLGLPPMFTPLSYVYDLPQLFLWSLGLLMLARGKTGKFLLVYSIGLFNKETTVLLSIMYGLLYMPWPKVKLMGRARFLWYGVAQIVIFIGYRTVVGAWFSGNPGQWVESHLLDHNVDLLKTYTPGFAVTALLLVLLIGYRWREKPVFLKYALVASVPLFVMTLFSGMLDEVRVFLEVYPTLWLMAIPAIGSILGYRVSVRSGFAPA